MDFNARAYCTTDQVGRMWNYNPEMTRNSRKGSLPVSRKCDPVYPKRDPVSQICDRVSKKRGPSFQKLSPGFSKMLSSFPKGGMRFWLFCNFWKAFKRKVLGILIGDSVFQKWNTVSWNCDLASQKCDLVFVKVFSFFWDQTLFLENRVTISWNQVFVTIFYVYFASWSSLNYNFQRAWVNLPKLLKIN